MWTCGAAIGDDSDITFKLKEPEDKPRGSGADADKGVLFTIASELAAADPQAAYAAIKYSLQTRVDWAMGAHLPEETKPLAAAFDRPLRASYVLCLGGRGHSTRAVFRSRRRTEPSCATVLYSQSDLEAVATNGGARALP